MTKVKKPVIRVRIAPSPTGRLHIGTARTALFNWLFAKHHGGAFIVRIEDTDSERSKKIYEDDILQGLTWLGLKFDEFYRQSERTKYYAKYIQKLLDDKKAFWCFHGKAELEEERSRQSEKKELPRHLCSHKFQTAPAGAKQTASQGIIRLAVDENSTRKIVFADMIKGEIEFEERLFGDISIAKDINAPLYNFAVAVDDYTMGISHVIRGEDHIANTPKQRLIYEALGWTPPVFAHLPLILGPDRAKMSKRDGETSVIDYKNAGYLPEAVINFLARLGWTPKTEREILTVNEIIEQFDLTKIHQSGAIFNIQKLNWINSQYLKLENDEGLGALAAPFVEKYFGRQDKAKIIKLVPLLRERLEYLDQVKEFHYFFKAPEFGSELLVWEKSDQAGAKKVLQIILERFNQTPDWSSKEMRAQLDKIANTVCDGDRGAVYWPLRVALSGERYSADPVQIMSILTKEEVLSRIAKALSQLTAQIDVSEND